MPIWANVKNNAILRSSLGKDSTGVFVDASEYGIAAVNHPLNFTSSSLDAAARCVLFEWYSILNAVERFFI